MATDTSSSASASQPHRRVFIAASVPQVAFLTRWRGGLMIVGVLMAVVGAIFGLGALGMGTLFGW
jgi:hypothetical protein